MAEQGRILIVDDEPEQVMLLSEVLKGMGYAIRGVTDGREALDVLRREPFDLLITDIKMPEVDGMEVVDHAARLAHPPEVILITGYPSLDTAQLAIERGVHDYLIKPLNYAELGVKVRKALAGRRLSRENLMLREIASIHEATRKLTLARNLDDLLDLIMDECFATARAESGSIMLAMEGEPGLVVRLVRGRRDERVMKVGTRLTEGIACQVAVRGEPVLIRGREILPDIGFRPKPDWELGSSISLPLKAEERILGVVNLNRSVAASPFDQIDLNVASVMAMQAGVSIENAILKDRLQGKIGELEAANRRAEEAYRELLQAEKLSAIGLMAGTVAHDINNPLSVIDGRAQILLYKLGAESEVGQSLSAMKVQIDRIANLVRGLRNYARKTRPEMRPLSVVECIEESFVLVDKLLYENGVKTSKRYPESVPPVMGNPTEIEQVFMNLIQNAGQAMEKGGELKVTVQVVDGRWLEATVSDSGPGIPPEVQKAIFEPFYTTKAEGVGTGLGLPICSRIIKDHQGEITVESAVGQGATFRVRLPAIAEGDPGRRA